MSNYLQVRLRGGSVLPELARFFCEGRMYPRYRLRPSAVASRTRSWIAARARSFRVRQRRPGCDRAARSSAIGTEDTAWRKKLGDRAPSGEVMEGRGADVLLVGAALGIEDGVRKRRLGHCRRVLSIFSWYSFVLEICAVCGIVSAPRRVRHCLLRRV